MSDYTITTNFGAKDSLNTNDPAKVIKGAEFTTEFEAIKTAVNSKADEASPTFTGTATIPTASVTTLNLGGTAVTSTAAELNILDGVTATAAELNILDGVTASTADLNLIDVTTLGLTAPSEAVTTDATGHVKFPDSKSLYFGNGGDLEFLHDGSKSIIRQAGTGNLELQYGLNSKLEVSSTGVDVTGRMVADNVRITIGSEINPTDSGTAGDLHFSSTYIYVCVATDTWKRVAISTWSPEF